MPAGREPGAAPRGRGGGGRGRGALTAAAPRAQVAQADGATFGGQRLCGLQAVTCTVSSVTYRQSR